MLARYTEYTSPSGNTKIYIVQKKQETLTGKWNRLSERKKYIVKQKLLGLALVVLGAVGCFIIPDDCGGCLMACGMGVLRVVFN